MMWKNERGEKHVIETESSIPDWDHSKTPFYYDYQKEEWVYHEDSKHRAKENIDRDEIEEIIDEKLREGIDGYKEKTYWGEEYEFNDDDDDDN